MKYKNEIIKPNYKTITVFTNNNFISTKSINKKKKNDSILSETLKQTPFDRGKRVIVIIIFCNHMLPIIV